MRNSTVVVLVGLLLFVLPVPGTFILGAVVTILGAIARLLGW
ncbi:MAG: transporter [Halobaculum sp.]